MLAERKISENIWNDTDSIIITNYDKYDREIDSVILSNKQTIPQEDTIPDEENETPAISYIMPQNKSLRAMSVKNTEFRGRQNEGSRGPKLRFENKIKYKSRSRSNKKFSSTNRKPTNFNRTNGCLSNRELTVSLNQNHQPKIWANMSSNFRFEAQAKALRAHKPPLGDPQMRTLNIERVKWDVSGSFQDIAQREKSYNSLVKASLKLKKLASTHKRKDDSKSNSMVGWPSTSVTGSIKAADITSETVSQTSVSTSHIPKPHNKMSIKEKLQGTKRTRIYLNKWKTNVKPTNDMNNNAENQSNIGEGFVREIFGGGSFIKYLKQADQ